MTSLLTQEKIEGIDAVESELLLGKHFDVLAGMESVPQLARGSASRFIDTIYAVPWR